LYKAPAWVYHKPNTTENEYIKRRDEELKSKLDTVLVLDGKKKIDPIDVSKSFYNVTYHRGQIRIHQVK